MSKGGILSVLEENERSETILRSSAVRCSVQVQFHTRLHWTRAVPTKIPGIVTRFWILSLAIQIPPRRDCKLNDTNTDVLLSFPASCGKIQATCSAGGR